MAAPATDDLRELARLLVIAGETGETRSFASLQEELGVGHDDLQAMLGTLAEHARAEELAPGEWTAPDPGAVTREQRVVVAVPEPEELEESDPPARRAQLVTAGGDTTVRLTRSIADALGEEALGQIVKAGLAGVGELDAFTLEVLP